MSESGRGSHASSVTLKATDTAGDAAGAARPLAAPRPSVGAHLRDALAVMSPAYFALAMATGIVAMACHLHGLREFATFLAWLNVLLYPVLWALFIARVVLFPSKVLADCSSHGRAPGFFTAVAATGVVGAQMVVLHASPLLGKVLWWSCAVLWALCTYGVFARLTTRADKPSLSEGINGGWLVAVVATQSVAVLGCLVDGNVLGDRETSLFILMSFWLGGGMLYIWIIGLIFYRYMFFPVSEHDLMPAYWINMGAVAISTLAGALLANAAGSSAVLLPLRPFILGLSVMFWATATWWIPMLLLLGLWRHRIRRVRFSYDPLYWGLVFPLGMYSVATYRLGEALQAHVLVWIARVFVIAAAGAWLVTFLGLGGRLVYTFVLWLRRPRPVPTLSPVPANGEVRPWKTQGVVR